MKCPCCGGTIAPSDITVDLNSNTVAVGRTEKQVKLGPREAEIAYILASNPIRFLTANFIISSVWESDCAINNLNVQIHRMRKKLEQIGLAIENKFCSGFRFRRITKQLSAVEKVRAAYKENFGVAPSESQVLCMLNDLGKVG